MTLPAFAAERRAAGCPPLSIDLPPAGPTAAKLVAVPFGAVGDPCWDRQTDRRTPYRYIDPALHSMRSSSVDKLYDDTCGTVTT